MATNRRRHSRTGRRLTGGLAGAVALSVTLILSAWGDTSRFGAPSVWPWLLTGIQVLALWAAGRRWWWGWLLGGMVQIPWIAYAAMTGQIGFIPGCAVSASIQAYAFLRASADGGEGTEIPRRLQGVTT